MITPSRRGVALCVAASLALTPAPALAQTAAPTTMPQQAEAADTSGQDDGSSLSSGKPSFTGSSVIDLMSLIGAFLSMKSDITSSVMPAMAIAALMGGLIGEIAFTQHIFGSSNASSEALGSSNVNIDDTFPDENAAPAEFVSLKHERDNLYTLTVYSPSMDKEITNDLVLPEGGPDNTTPRPTYYLLGGAGGGGWTGEGGAPDFFRDKLINVVTPRGAIGSQQADWAFPDDKLGQNKWSTYITKELPQLMDSMFYGNGRDAIAGMSMSGGPALLMSTMDERFKVAGTYSSCQSTTGIVGQSFADLTVRYYKGDPKNMWGGSSDPAWAAHSPILNVEKLRGKTLFAAASRGEMREDDAPTGDSPQPLLAIDEQLAYVCTRAFVDEATDAGIDVDFYELVDGTHNWNTFRRELPETWKTIGPALGVE